MTIIYGLEMIIKNTPIWVWFVLLFLVKRGVALKNDGEVSLSKSLLVPCVFILWGLEKIFSGFAYPLKSLALYALFVAIGTFVGYLLYSATQKFYYLDGVFTRRGSIVPLWVILANFCIKYVLNVAMAVNPTLINHLAFNLGYSMIAGFTVGLFVGGIVNTLLNQKELKGRNEFI